MHLRHWIGLASFSALTLMGAEKPSFAEVSADKPNVLFIFVDDQGYYDLGCYGATEVKTPRINALAKEGIRFTDYYAAAPICSPSRAGLLTGCYPRRVGMEVWVQRADLKRGLAEDELTMAELFKSAGYATGCIGKWHLGDQDPAFLPLQQGFDSYFGLLHNLDDVETIYFGDQGVPLVRGDGEVVKRPADPAELTRLYTDEAIRFMTEKKDEPFFLYLPHTMLHNPLGVGEEFKGTSNWGEYGDAIQEMDFHVGRLMDTLKELGIAEKTIVLYVSDNGRGPGRNPQQPMKGSKLTTWECGIRVPAIAWGPGVGIRAGCESAAVVSAMDWYPSLASLAGIRVPEDRVIDGRDISPLLLGKTDDVPAAEAKLSLNADVPLRRRWEQPGEWQPLFTRDEYTNAFFYHGSEGQLAAVRSGDFKLILTPNLTLYNLAKDPGETKPVRGEEIRKLRGMAVMFQEEMNRDARQAGEAK
ncbi:MAG: sulfatase [Verrucomicrobiales bacterium]|nr:sulfatase [Verrucomicrobiales bacterium]